MKYHRVQERKGQMKTRRKFTPEFKSEVVLQLLSDEQSMAELYRTHQLTSQVIWNWKQHILSPFSRTRRYGVTPGAG